MSKYVIETLTRELGLLIEQKRDAEYSYSKGDLKHQEYLTLKDTYENRYKEVQDEISHIQSRPDVKIEADPRLISSISCAGKVVPFSIDDLEEFMSLKKDEKFHRHQLETLIKYAKNIYDCEGTQALRELGFDVIFDNEEGYLLNLPLDKSH